MCTGKIFIYKCRNWILGKQINKSRRTHISLTLPLHFVHRHSLRYSTLYLLYFLFTSFENKIHSLASMGPQIITYSLYFITIAKVIMAREIYLIHAQPINHSLVYFYVASWFILNLSGRQALYHKRNLLSHLFVHFSWSSHNSFNSYYLYAIIFWLFCQQAYENEYDSVPRLFRTHHPVRKQRIIVYATPISKLILWWPKGVRDPIEG